MTENNAAQELPDFNSPEVQAVYETLCGTGQPPAGEHWDGWVSRHIVLTLRKLRAPVADERAAFEAIVKRLGGDCTWRPGYGYVSSMTRLYQNFWRQIHAEQGNRNDG